MMFKLRIDSALRNILILTLIFFATELRSQAVLNAYTSAQMDSIHNNSLAVDGDIYFDTQASAYYLGVSSGALIRLTPSNKSETVVLNRSGGSIVTSTNTYYDLPLNTPNIMQIDSTLFQVVGDGEVRVLEAGTYLVTSSISVRNLAAGNSKYILGMRINGSLRGYLTRGVAVVSSGTDYWGTSGSLMYNFNQNDVINIRYVINNQSPLSLGFCNIGITKL